MAATIDQLGNGAVKATDEAGENAQGTDARRQWLALAVVLSGAFLAVLDFFIVNVSVTAIQTGLPATFAEVQFVIAGYGLAYAIGLITGGRLGDLYGRKKIFLTGLAGFTALSLLCGLANSAAMLVVMRVLQGLAAALMFPQVLSIIQTTFAGEERSRAFSMFGATIGFASVAGQILGGVLLSLNLFGWGWRWVFLVKVPLGIAAFALAVPLVRESRAKSCAKLDAGGVLLISAALMLLIYPLVAGRAAGFPLWTYVCLAACPPVLALFIFYERWRERHGRSPLIESSLLTHRTFVVGLMLTLVLFVGMALFFLLLTLYLQSGNGFTPLRAGLTFMPFAVGFLVASNFAPRVAARLGNRVLQLGLAIMIGGLLILMWIATAYTIELHGAELAPALFIYGLGQGFVAPPLMQFILGDISAAEAGSASGVLTTVQQIASALGVALLGVVLFGAVETGEIRTNTDDLAADTATRREGVPVANNGESLSSSSNRSRYGAAVAYTLRYNIATLIAGALFVFLLPGATQAKQDEKLRAKTRNCSGVAAPG